MKKRNLIPDSDSTTQSLAMDTEEKHALSTVIPMNSKLMKGTLERIMRLFFCINIEFWAWLSLDNFPLVLVKLVIFSVVLVWFFFSAAKMIEALFGLELLLLLWFCFSQHRKWNSVMLLQADALIKEVNCTKTRNAGCKGLFRLCYGLWNIIPSEVLIGMAGKIFCSVQNKKINY